jgi:hypothetical protein
MELPKHHQVTLSIRPSRIVWAADRSAAGPSEVSAARQGVNVTNELHTLARRARFRHLYGVGETPDQTSPKDPS